MENTLDISWETIIKVLIAGLAFYILYLARDIAVWFFFGLIISVLFEPAIKFLRKLYVPKVIAVVFVYSSIFGILGLLIYLTAPIFVHELKQFSQFLPDYLVRVNPILSQFGLDLSLKGGITDILVNNLEQGSRGIIQAIMIFFGGVSASLVILTIAFFLSLEERSVERFLLLLTPKKYEGYIASIFEKSQKKVSGWFAARILACAFVGIASFIVFYIFSVKYAFILALFAGVLNFVPYIGPLITAILLFIFMLVSSGSWFVIIYVLLAFSVIQWLEGFLLTPILMKKMLDLPPVLVLVALLVGGQIFGFLGMIFSVPVFGIVYEFLKEFFEERRETTA